MDCSVIPIRSGGLVLIQTVDYFYPLVDDPYIMVVIGSVSHMVILWLISWLGKDNLRQRSEWLVRHGSDGMR